MTGAHSQQYGGYPIANGDLLLLVATENNTSTATPTLTCPTTAVVSPLTPTGPENGWTAISGAPAVMGTGGPDYPQNSIVCWKIANSADSDVYSNQLVPASGSWLITATTVPLSVAPLGIQGSGAYGWPVWDYTKASLLGYVSSISGTTLTLTTTANFASSGSADKLIFGPWVVPTGGVAPTRYARSLAIDVANADQVTPIDPASSCAAVGGLAVSGSTPAGSTTAAGDTLLSIILAYNNMYNVNHPATGDNIYRPSGAAPYVNVIYEYLGAAGAAMSRTWTLTSGTTEWIGCAVGIRHN